MILIWKDLHLEILLSPNFESCYTERKIKKIKNKYFPDFLYHAFSHVNFILMAPQNKGKKELCEKIVETFYVYRIFIWFFSQLFSCKFIWITPQTKGKLSEKKMVEHLVSIKYFSSFLYKEGYDIISLTTKLSQHNYGTKSFFIRKII